MVHSFSLPLKPSDEAIIKFLMSLVFGSSRQLKTQMNRRECLHHDIIGANKLIYWILDNDRKNRKSFSSVCNLVYGNTLVLSSQVTRLLYDTIRAKEVVSFSTFNALEEERKRKTREQMEKSLDDYVTPKKKRNSKATELPTGDKHLIASPLISQALKQSITMPDVVSIQQGFDPYPEDDLVPATEQQFELLYGLLDPSDRPLSSPFQPNDEAARTFIERNSSDKSRERSQLIDMDFEFPVQNRELVEELFQTPRKSPPAEEMFEPASHLADILLYGRLPILSEEERRKSLEDEMEEARSRAINNDFQTPDRLNVHPPSPIDFQPDVDFVRIPSQIHLDEDIMIPILAKTPRTAAKSRKTSKDDELNGIDNRVPLRDMHRRMEDFSSLHFSDTLPFLVRINSEMTLSELMNPVPYQFRRHANKDLHYPFRIGPKKHDSDLGNHISDEESEPVSKKSRPSDFDYEPLDPINLSQLGFMATPLKDDIPESPIRRPDFEMVDEFEYPRNREERFEAPLTPVPEFARPETTILFDDFELSERRPPRSPIDSSGTEDNIASNEQIRGRVLEECKSASPFEIDFETIIPTKATRREAARSFYVVLELLKEFQIVAQQKNPFGPIKVTLNSEDSDDLDAIADE